ncbi:hypothetical protein OROHE_010202 [Orobanche hederae]
MYSWCQLEAWRGRSTLNSDAEIIKVKRSDTPDDILSALLKKDNEDNNDDDVKKGSKYEENVHNEDEDEDGMGTEHDKKRSRHISYGCDSVEGKMKHGMEDYLVAKCKEIDGRELGLYAIFDGHSGHEVAEYLQKNLFDNILNEVDFWTSPKTAVEKAFKSTNNHILENVVGSRGGSTAVVAILINKEKLIVANVGDSRAVLCRKGKIKQITVDHEPLREKKLVESKGGFLSKKPVFVDGITDSCSTWAGNVPRVDGQLAVTRAFGDEKLKDHITAEPDIMVENMDESMEFIILASDGLWNVNYSASRTAIA